MLSPEQEKRHQSDWKKDRCRKRAEAHPHDSQRMRPNICRKACLGILCFEIAPAPRICDVSRVTVNEERPMRKLFHRVPGVRERLWSHSCQELFLADVFAALTGCLLLFTEIFPKPLFFSGIEPANLIAKP